MIKLIITDLDGTFLDSQGDYDRNLYAEVHDLMAKQGIHFAACTGKQCDRVEELFGSYSSDMWIIGDSATCIKYNHEVIYQSFIPNQLGISIINQLEQVNSDHVIIACTAQGAIIRNDISQKFKHKVRGSYANIIEVNDLKEITADFIKITVYDEAGNCPQTRQYLTAFDNDVYIVVSESSWIDITEYGVHKGTTIQRLQKQLNIAPCETMAFGDGYNDIELLEQAEYSFAMRNAFEATKKVAKFITGFNDESAVQNTIKQILLLQAK